MLLQQSMPRLLAASAMLAVNSASALPHMSMEKQVVVRNAPGLTSEETRSALKRSVVGMVRKNDSSNVLKGKTVTLDRSWKNATLLGLEGFEMNCADCYIRGTASTKLSTSSSNDDIETGITQMFDDLADSFDNVAQSTVEWIKNASNNSFNEIPQEFVQALLDGDESLPDHIMDAFDSAKDSLKGLFGDAVDEVEEVGDDSTVGGIVDDASDAVGDFFDGAADDIGSFFKREDFFSFDQLDKFELPSLDTDLDLDSLEPLGVDLHLGLEDVEIYLMMDTIISGEKKKPIFFPLFTTPTPLGFGDDNFVGVTFKVELYLIPGLEDVDMSSGVHFSLEELGFDLNLFADDITDMAFNGGQFELLPVTLNSIGAVDIKAGLRLSIEAGIQADIPVGRADVSTGMSVSVFADLAQFDTKISFLDDEDQGDCATRLDQDFEVNIGAGAGASVAVLGMNFGPTPATSTPIFSTPLPGHCLEDKNPGTAPAITTATAVITTTTTTIPGPPPATTPAPSPVEKRDDLSTATTAVPITMQAIICESPGLVYCPASLQTRIKTTSTKTFTTAVPDGADLGEWPPSSVMSVVTQPSAFGSNVQKIVTTNFTPSPSPTS